MRKNKCFAPNIKDAAGPYLINLILFLVGLLVVYSIPAVYRLPDGNIPYVYVNALGPALLGLACGAVVVATVKRLPAAIWTTYVAFLAQAVVFSGIGPLVYVFGDEATLSRLANGPLSVTDAQLWRTNILATAGVLSVLLGFLTVQLCTRKGVMRAGYESVRNVRMPQLAVVFLLTGAVLRFGLVLPYKFNVLDIVVPGAVTTLANLFPVGLALVGYLSVRRRGGWSILFYVLTSLNVGIAIAEFSKTSAVISLLLPGLGRYIAHRKARRLVVWVVLGAMLYAWMQPLVHFGREVIYQEAGDINTASLAERAKIISRYILGESGNGQSADQKGWTRLAYSGPQAYAMELYDSGYPHNTLRNVIVLFVPRVVWPEKPIVIGPGAAFYELVTGRSGSFLGLSIYGDAYWMAGWCGVFFACWVIGILFGWMSNNTLKWIGTGQLIFLPVVFISLEMALLGPTKYIINGVIGPLPIYLTYVFATSITSAFLARSSRSRRRALRG